MEERPRAALVCVMERTRAVCEFWLIAPVPLLSCFVCSLKPRAFARIVAHPLESCGVGMCVACVV